MRKESTILFLLIALSIKVIGQHNYIQNHSFEQIKKCPEEVNTGYLKLVENWSQPTMASTDIYQKSCLGFAKTPKNKSGNQIPVSGVAYIGMYLGVANIYSKNYCEYFQNRLNRKLTEGKLYYFECKLSLAECSEYFCKRFGVSFNGKKVFRPFYRQELKLKQGLDIDLSDDYSYKEWIVASGYYLATGTEQFLIIGNFHGNSVTEKLQLSDDLQRELKMKYEFAKYAYYFIDDVFLLESRSIKQHILNRMQDTAVNMNFVDHRTKFYEYRWDTVAFDAVTKDTSWCSSIDTSSQFAKNIGHYIQNDSVDSVFIVNYYSSGECEFVRYTNSLTYANSIKKWIKIQRPNLYCEAFGLDGNPNGTKPATGKVICRTELLLKKRQ